MADETKVGFLHSNYYVLPISFLDAEKTKSPLRQSAARRQSIASPPPASQPASDHVLRLSSGGRTREGPPTTKQEGKGSGCSTASRTRMFF